MDWRHRAICRNEDDELFFPVGSTGPAARQLAEAKQVCARCPVREDCLEWAVDNRVAFGVWGGQSEEEREAAKRRAARSRTRTYSDA